MVLITKVEVSFLDAEQGGELGVIDPLECGQVSGDDRCRRRRDPML